LYHDPLKHWPTLISLATTSSAVMHHVLSSDVEVASWKYSWVAGTQQ